MKFQVELSSRSISVLAGLAVLVGGLTGDCPGASDPQSGTGKLRLHRSPYYDIYSDLEADLVREAAVRLTAVAREYHRRTKGLTEKPPPRMPFYLFSNKEDYHAAGGIPGTTGIYFRRKLMALAPKPIHDGFWRTIQHEAFHQFAHQTISRKTPVWLDEGLAEYFEHGIWTGDGFVTGMIPPARLKRVKKMISEDRVRPFEEMIEMTRLEWNAELLKANYDQAWSMVHFLVQGEGGRYQQGFAEFVNDIADYRPLKMAFKRRFGPDLRDLQRRYSWWWSSLPDNPTGERYDLAIVQTLTSYLGRACAQRQVFPDAEAFMLGGRNGQLKCDPGQWLPPSLLGGALKKARTAGQWSLVKTRGVPELVLERPDGVIFTGAFEIRGSKVRNVRVTVLRPEQTERARPGQGPPRSK